MKRSPLRRKRGIDKMVDPETGKEVYRPRKRLPRSNRKRRARRYEENFGERADAVRAMPCLLDGLGGCRGPTEPAHVKSRGAGGNRRHLVPLCSGHHAEQHACGILTFQERHGLDLAAKAESLAADFDRHGLP